MEQGLEIGRCSIWLKLRKSKNEAHPPEAMTLKELNERAQEWGLEDPVIKLGVSGKITTATGIGLLNGWLIIDNIGCEDEPDAHPAEAPKTNTQSQ